MERQDWSAVDLPNRQLTKIPDDVIANAQQVLHLDLSENPELKFSGWISKFINVKSLQLERCAITEVPEEVFELNQVQKLSLAENFRIAFLSSSIGNLRLLMEVNLKDCNLSSLPDAFWGLKNLQKVSFQNNEGLHTLSPSIRNLKQLKELNLANCGLSDIPKELWDLKQLEKLSFQDNRDLCLISPSIKKLQLLNDLNLERCNLTDLPEQFWDLKQLEKLSLSRNHMLSDLSPSIQKLTSLKDLNIGCCFLLDLPEELWEVRSLEKLDLSFNVLHNGLSSSIQKLRSLKEFTFGSFDKTMNIFEARKVIMWKFGLRGIASMKKFSNFGLDIVPNKFWLLQSLQKLCITGNTHLACPTFAIGKLRSLKQLAIKGFGIERLPEDFSKLCYLEVLRLEDNKHLESLCSSFGEFVSLKELQISGCRMKSLPESFGQLRQLEVLNLDDNEQLESLCTSFGELPKLKKLHISRCQMKSLPESFGQLIKLEILTLDDNEQMESLCLSFGKLPSLKILHISGCQIKSLPESFGQLQMLKSLIVCGIPLNISYDLGDVMENHNGNVDGMMDYIDREFERIRRRNEEREVLRRRDPVIDNDVQQMEAHMEGYQHAVELPLKLLVKNQVRPMENGEQLEHLCASFGELRALEVLHISYCGIKSLPQSFGRLCKLKTLYLRENKHLEDIGLSFGKLTALKKLYIEKCGLRSLPETFKDLKKLKVLDLMKNEQLESLCSKFGELSSLQSLRISFCRIKNLPESFEKLHKLDVVVLENNNQLESLCSSIGNLRALRGLQISDCRLRSLPESFDQLHNLKALVLRDNCLEEYPRCTLSLVNLRQLDLSNKSRTSDGNSIQSLPNDLVNTNLEELVLDGNPITLPPRSVWKQGVHAIKLYMQEREISGVTKFIADSINMLGESEAGKTSISLLLQEYNLDFIAEDRTRVMTRRIMNVGDLSLYINDFGGHPIYQSVIPIVMPPTGLAIVAYDLTKTKNEQEREVAKWVHTAIAKSSEIRIVVAGTRSDKLSLEMASPLSKNMENFVQKSVDKFKKVVQAAIKQHTPNGEKWKALQATDSKLAKRCMKFKAVSAVPKLSQDFNEFRKLVSDSLQKPQSIPYRWYQVMMKIINHSSKTPYISMEDVRKMYKECFENDDRYEHLDVILNCLVDSSHIIWLKKSECLRDIVFHSPQQIVDICKKVFHHDREVQEEDEYKTEKENYKKGFLSEQYLMHLLDEEDLEVIETVVNFLQNFNLLSTLQTRGGVGVNFRKFAIATHTNDEPIRVSELDKIVLEAPACVELSFEGSMVPLSFFETSKLMISTKLSAQFGNAPVIEMWRDGLLAEHNSMYFVMKRRDDKEDKITLTSGRLKTGRNPWTILSRVMSLLEENIAVSWPGIFAKWVIMCPACIFLRQSPIGNQEMDYDTFDDTIGSTELSGKLMNRENMETKKRMEDLHFGNCKHSVPMVLCCQTLRDFTSEEEGYVASFYATLASMKESEATGMEDDTESTLLRKWHDMNSQQLHEIFRSMSYDLSNTMTIEQVYDATRKLWSLKLILSIEKDTVNLPGKTAFVAASELIDIITTKNTKELYCAFLDHQANLKRTDIIEAFTKSIPQVS